jgi:hypothetical protein
LFANQISLDEPLKKYYKGESLIFTGYRPTNDYTYYTSDIIEIKELDVKTHFVEYYRCKCEVQLKNPKKVAKCTACGIKGRSVLGHNLRFYSITDQNNVQWFKPYDDDVDKFQEIRSDFKAHCLKVRKKDEWKKYLGFCDTWDANLVYKYAMTVHKAQGSEFDIVFVDAANIRTNRKAPECSRLIYTAVSRFKQCCYFI